MPEKCDFLRDYLSEGYHARLRAFLSLYEVRLVSCAYWRNRAPWSVDWRKCPDSFMLFPLRGNVRIRLNGQDRVIGPGRFVMLAAGVAHALEGPRSGFLHQISLHCHVTDRWKRPLLSRFRTPFGKLPAWEQWGKTLKELAALMSSEPSLGELRGEIVLNELIANRLRDERDLILQTAGGDARVALVLEEMHKHDASPHLSIEMLSTKAEISPVQLRKLFRRQLGVGPKAYLNGLRLRKATRLLMRTTLSVKQVAHDCGFASDHYFHLVFRTSMGCTPSEFRTRATP